MIPTDRLRPHIEKWIEQNQSTAVAFAQATGVEPSLIRKILTGGATSYTSNGKKHEYEKTHVNFPTADKIITKGLGNPFLWWTDFKDFYTEIPLNDYERSLLA